MIITPYSKAQYGCDICGLLITEKNKCIGGDEFNGVAITMPWERGGLGNTVSMNAQYHGQSGIAFCKTCVGKELIRQTKD